MTNVDGLRPTQSSRPKLRQKEGRVVTRRDVQQQVQLRPSAAPVASFVRAPEVQVSGDTMRLAQALSSISPALAQVGRGAAEARVAEQKAIDEGYLENLKYHAERFTQDREVGAVKAAQLKQITPDASPIVAAKLAQAIGRKEAGTWVQDRIQGILENDSIRLNSQARQAEIAKIKAEAIALVGDDPEHAFYGGGFLDKVSSSMAEFEMNWVRETAAHQEKILAEDFSSRVEKTLLGGGDLVALDAEEGQSSALDNLQRKQIVFDTALNTAMARKDKSLLDRIPPLFLNAESKQKIAQAKEQIDNARFTKWSQAKQVEEYNRQAQERSMMRQALQRMASGEDLDPAEYANNPKVFEFVASNISKPLVNPVKSARNSAWVRDRILQAGISGSYSDALGEGFSAFMGGEDNVSVEAMQDYVTNLDGIGAADRQKLIEEIPQLMDGVNFMRDEYVTTAFRTVEEDIKAFMASPLSQVVVMRGVNPQTEVRRAYQQFIQQEVLEDLETGKGVPTGARKKEIVRGAEEVAISRLQRIQQMVGDNKQQPAAPAVSSSESGAPKKVRRFNPSTGKLEEVTE